MNKTWVGYCIVENGLPKRFAKTKDEAVKQVCGTYAYSPVFEIVKVKIILEASESKGGKV